MTALKMQQNYWVVHTDCYGNGTYKHTKQVMSEQWENGKITERPESERYILKHEDFVKAMDAYDWNEVLGKPEDYVKGA